MSSGERHNIAQELAAKDEQDFETLSEVMTNAYLHNADLVIEERTRPPVDEVTGKPLYSCDRCQDKAYVGEKPCLECNPMGLPAEQVYPQQELKEVVQAEGESLSDIAAEANAFANALMPRLEGEGKKAWENAIGDAADETMRARFEVLDDSDSGTGQTDSDTGKLYTSKPKRTKKHQAKK